MTSNRDAPMATGSIQVRGLGKTYRVADKLPGLGGTLRHLLRRRLRDVPAVQDVTFTIEPGEMVGFLGPNGAGKTTTLKMLSGLIHPTTGTVRVAGHVPQRRQRAFLQEAAGKLEILHRRHLRQATRSAMPDSWR